MKSLLCLSCISYSAEQFETLGYKCIEGSIEEKEYENIKNEIDINKKVRKVLDLFLKYDTLFFSEKFFEYNWKKDQSTNDREFWLLLGMMAIKLGRQFEILFVSYSDSSDEPLFSLITERGLRILSQEEIK